MRLIDADKLKEYVKSKSTHPLCEWDTAGVLMAIDEQETVEEDWISVKQKLPEEKISENGYSMGCHVLCSCKGGLVDTSFFYQGHFETLEKRGYEVLAWMPRPESYKE